MAKFGKGDRVRLIGNRPGVGLLPGATGTVVESDSGIPYVEWDGFSGGHDGPFGDYRDSCWAVIEEDLECEEAR